MPSHLLSLLHLVAYQIANCSMPLRPWSLSLLLLYDPHSRLKPCSTFCVVFVFIFTKISIISSILYPKTYKMHVISHFLLKIFGSFKKMYYLCSAFEKIK